MSHIFYGKYCSWCGQKACLVERSPETGRLLPCAEAPFGNLPCTVLVFFVCVGLKSFSFFRDPPEANSTRI